MGQEGSDHKQTQGATPGGIHAEGGSAARDGAGEQSGRRSSRQNGGLSSGKHAATRHR